MIDLNVAAVTVIGQKHRQRGVPCEDASIAVSANGVSAVVVADGAGSKQYTHARFGSAAAVKTIADLLTEHFDALYNENREAAVRSLIIAALHVKFADLIVEHKLDSIERLSCTLLFCAVKDRRMIAGHIGDGLIVKVTPSGLSPLTMPQNGASSAAAPASSSAAAAASSAASSARAGRQQRIRVNSGANKNRRIERRVIGGLFSRGNAGAQTETVSVQRRSVPPGEVNFNASPDREPARVSFPRRSRD